MTELLSLIFEVYIAVTKEAIHCSEYTSSPEKKEIKYFFKPRTSNLTTCVLSYDGQKTSATEIFNFYNYFNQSKNMKFHLHWLSGRLLNESTHMCDLEVIGFRLTS